MQKILERQIDQFEAERNEEDNEEAQKPTKEFSSVQLLDINDEETGELHVYLIAGKKDIFLLGENNEQWARRLTEEEINEFPYNIYWTGKDTNFEVDSRRTTELREYLVLNIVKIRDGVL